MCKKENIKYKRNRIHSESRFRKGEHRDKKFPRNETER
jgi:hypothetical protein